MLTGDEYRESLRDGRATYFEGEVVDDLPNHPILGICVDVVAKTYDKFYQPGPDARSPLMGVPRSAEELRDRIPLLHEAGMMAHVTYTSIMTLITAAGRLDKLDREYLRRIEEYVEHAQAADVRITQCITDAKGDRSRPRGATRTTPMPMCAWLNGAADGVVIRGAKLHIIGSVAWAMNCMTIPDQGDEARARKTTAIACDGARQCAGREDRQHDLRTAPRATPADFPVSGQSSLRQKAS